jgi:tetratricopeptide (TPR) repeat protein
MVEIMFGLGLMGKTGQASRRVEIVQEQAQLRSIAGLILSLSLACFPCAHADDLRKAVKTNADEIAKRASRECSDKALIYIKKRQMKESLHMAERAIRLDPGNGDALVYKGIVLDEYEHFDEGLKYLNEGIKLQPKLSDPWGYMERAEALGREKKWDAALVDVTKAINMCPHEAWRYAVRGRICVGAGRYADALKDMSTAIRLKPQDAYLYFERGTVWNALSKYDMAIADYNRAIAKQPDCSSYYAARAKIYDKTGRHDLAEKDRAKANQGYFDMMPAKTE